MCQYREVDFQIVSAIKIKIRWGEHQGVSCDSCKFEELQAVYHRSWYKNYARKHNFSTHLSARSLYLKTTVNYRTAVLQLLVFVHVIECSCSTGARVYFVAAKHFRKIKNFAILYQMSVHCIKNLHCILGRKQWRWFKSRNMFSSILWTACPLSIWLHCVEAKISDHNTTFTNFILVIDNDLMVK